MKINLNKLNDRIFLIAYIFITMAYMYTNVDIISPYVDIFNKIGLILLTILFVIQFRKYNIKTLFIMVIVFITLIISIYKIKSYYICQLLLILLVSKNIDINKFIKNIFFIQVFMFCTVVLFHMMGMTTDVIKYREDGSIRNSLGFSHPNRLGNYIFIMILEYIYIRKAKLKLYNYLIIGLVLITTNYFSDSRATLYSMIVTLIIIYIYNIVGKKILTNKFSKIIIINSFLILSILSFSLCYFYRNGNEMAEKINEALSNRILLMNRELENRTIKPYGYELNSIENERIVIDNAYGNIVIMYGWVINIFFLVLFTINFIELYKRENYSMIIVLFGYLIYSMFETHIFKVPFNPFLITFSQVIYKFEKNNQYLKGGNYEKNRNDNFSCIT